MANENQTALMQSIKRKKDRVEFLYEECKRLGIGTIGYERCSNEIVFLSREITEDEKLLAVEMEQRRFDYENGQFSAEYNPHVIGCISFTETPEGYISIIQEQIDQQNEKYGTDGK